MNAKQEKKTERYRSATVGCGRMGAFTSETSSN